VPRGAKLKRNTRSIFNLPVYKEPPRLGRRRGRGEGEGGGSRNDHRGSRRAAAAAAADPGAGEEEEEVRGKKGFRGRFGSSRHVSKPSAERKSAYRAKIY